MKLSLAAMLALVACSVFGGDTTAVKLHDDANALRLRLNLAHDRVVGRYELAYVVCVTLREEAVRAPCTELDAAVQALDLTYASARESIDVYERGVAAVDAVALLVAKYELAGTGVDVLADKVIVYAEATGKVDRDCVDAGSAAIGQHEAVTESVGSAADAQAATEAFAGAQRSADGAVGLGRDAALQVGAAAHTASAAGARP